jgi:DNA-binding LacI/PurR family transcriptional regulator
MVDILVDMLEGRERRPRKVIVEPTFIERGSLVVSGANEGGGR